MKKQVKKPAKLKPLEDGEYIKLPCDGTITIQRDAIRKHALFAVVKSAGWYQTSIGTVQIAVLPSSFSALEKLLKRAKLTFKKR